jgi:hypothetical protein
MAKSRDLNSIFRQAQRNMRPAYRKIRRMGTDDWLATVGLERRNLLVDVLSSSAFLLTGCAIGIGIGMLLSPKPGTELRRDLNRRVRDTAERIGIKEQPTYAS